MTPSPPAETNGLTSLIPLPPALAARGVSLRGETAADIPFLRALFASTRDERLLMAFPEAMRAGFIEQQFQAQRGHLRSRFADALFAVIEVQGDPVGRLCLSRGAAAHHVADIAVLPDWRGHGLGGGVLSAVQAGAAASGLPVTLFVDMLNGDARRLYRRLGFRAVAEEPPNILMDWRP